jgi:hypothetical protein
MDFLSSGAAQPTGYLILVAWQGGGKMRPTAALSVFLSPLCLKLLRFPLRAALLPWDAGAARALVRPLQHTE